jgi:hypothetical protein
VRSILEPTTTSRSRLALKSSQREFEPLSGGQSALPERPTLQTLSLKQGRSRSIFQPDSFTGTVKRFDSHEPSMTCSGHSL